jgi:hypothetical protein
LQLEKMPGKATDGIGRTERVQEILIGLIDGKLTLSEAYAKPAIMLPRASSIHAANNHAFAKDWGERLIRTQLSRFYNQAVLISILEDGEEMCFIPVSRTQQASSRCSANLAGKAHNAKALLDLLIEIYRDGNWGAGLTVPEHPHCTHVARPIQ